jgi:hypothetical protein
MDVFGSCHCGAITYRARVDPDKASVCHCTDCQKLSGSPYRVSIAAPADTFEILSGVPTIYVKTAESGNKRAHAFCPNCGAPVYSAAATTDPPTYTLRVGCLEQRALLPPRRQAWCRSAVPWPWSGDIRGLPAADRQ